MSTSTREARILFVIDSLAFGGAERQFVELLKGLDRSRFSPIVVYFYEARDGYRDVLEQLDMPIRCLGRQGRHDLLRPMMALRRIILDDEIDLVHTFMNLASVLGALAARTSSRPVICSAIRDGRDANLKLMLSKRMLSGIATVLVSNSRAGFENRFRRWKEHFRVIYNGIDLDRFRTGRAIAQAVRAGLNIRESEPVVGMVASFSPYKDHETLIRAIPRVLESYPKAAFVLVGDGPNREFLEGLAASLEVGGHVHFLGFRKDVDSLYAIFDVCVLLTNSDKIVEGLPNCLIEAQASGIPVIASRGGGVEEVVENGRTGLVIEPKSPYLVSEAICRLLEDERFQSRLSSAALINVRRSFALDRYVGDYQDLYTQVLEEVPPRTRSA